MGIRQERQKNPAPMPELCQQAFRITMNDTITIKNDILYLRQFLHANQELMLALAFILKIPPAQVAKAFKDREALKKYEEDVISHMKETNAHKSHIMGKVKENVGE